MRRTQAVTQKGTGDHSGELPLREMKGCSFRVDWCVIAGDHLMWLQGPRVVRLTPIGAYRYTADIGIVEGKQDPFERVGLACIGREPEFC